LKAVRFCGKSKVEIANIPRPELDEESVIIKVKASALCGSEMGAFRNPDGMGPEMCNVGHEVAGIIEEAPTGSRLKKGMRVGACVIQGCGSCSFCARGYETACADKKFYVANGHAEYFKLGVRGVMPAPEGVSWPAAAILTGDGLGVPVRAAARLGDTKNKKVLVLGLGPVGLSNVLVQAFKGADVMGADLFGFRLNLAMELGAGQAVNIKTQDLKEEVLDWTSGKGADIVILAAGRNDALLTAYDVVRQQGTVFQVAEFHEAVIDPSAAFVTKEITQTGSWYYTSTDWPEMLALHRAGLAYEKLVTHVFPVEKAQTAFDTFASGESGKVVLTYD